MSMICKLQNYAKIQSSLLSFISRSIINSVPINNVDLFTFDFKHDSPEQVHRNKKRFRSELRNLWIISIDAFRS